MAEVTESSVDGKRKYVVSTGERQRCASDQSHDD